jgi:hypothetical protein
MAPPCFGMVASFDAASQNSENMYTQIKSTAKSSTPVFIISGDPEPSATFVAGKCVCKTCRSKDLTFYRYLDDAKCDTCSQWQNEEPIPD